MNKFFTVNDKSIYDMDGFIISTGWWSRPYEYQFAIEHLDKDEVILDAGCGLQHPFKDYASKRVKKVYAVDRDENIKLKVDTETLEHKCICLTDINKEFEDNYFDKIFCISVIEHVPDSIVLILEQFKKVLKNNGKIILTLDYPTIKPVDLINIVENIGLEFVGEVDYTIDEANIVKGQYVRLRCFCAILTKKQ